MKKCVHIYGIRGKCVDCGKDELTPKQKRLIAKGLADAKAGRVVAYHTPAGKSRAYPDRQS